MSSLAIVAFMLIVGNAIIQSSAKGNEEKGKQERAAMEQPPQHSFEQNYASSSAWAWVVFIVIVGALAVGYGMR